MVCRAATSRKCDKVSTRIPDLARDGAAYAVAAKDDPCVCSREFALGWVVVLALLVLTNCALAQTYPSRPIRIVTPGSAGDAPDSIARLVAQTLSIQLGQPVIVENKPGASDVIGSEYVARAPPDGYVLLKKWKSLTARVKIGTG